MHEVKISADGIRSSVIVDGVELAQDLTGIDIRIQARNLPVVTLSVAVRENLHMVANDADVLIAQPAAATLKALGWIPPEAMGRPLDVDAALKAADQAHAGVTTEVTS